MKYTVWIWDIRDAESKEPASLIGTYYDLERAKKELDAYLLTQHGPYIYKHEIVKEK